MTEAEIRQAENVARSHINRIRSLEARIDTGRHSNVASTNPGIVPTLCETILKLTDELKQRRGIAP